MGLQAKKTKTRKRPEVERAIAELSKEDQTRFNAMIPTDLHSRLKIQAVKEGKGRTMTDIAIDAITEYLDRNG